MNAIDLFFLFLIGAGLLLAVVVLSARRSPIRGGGTLSGRVRHVVDGDTFYLHGSKTAVRLWGIDAPEMDTRAGHLAKKYLSGLLRRNSIRCEIISRDKYGRTVARCFGPDGRDIGGQLIKAGHAREMRRFSKGHYSGSVNTNKL